MFEQFLPSLPFDQGRELVIVEIDSVVEVSQPELLSAHDKLNDPQ
jgi:hypothetical protein